VKDRLRLARMDAGYKTRIDVVKKLGEGFSEATLYRWESGSADPPFAKVHVLADLYGVSLDWLASRTDSRATHRVGPDKILVDRERVEQLHSLRPGDPVPSDLIAPRFGGVWVVPERLDILDGRDAETFRVQIDCHIKELVRAARRRFL